MSSPERRREKAAEWARECEAEEVERRRRNSLTLHEMIQEGDLDWPLRSILETIADRLDKLGGVS